MQVMNDTRIEWNSEEDKLSSGDFSSPKKVNSIIEELREKGIDLQEYIAFCDKISKKAVPFEEVVLDVAEFLRQQYEDYNNGPNSKN